MPRTLNKAAKPDWLKIKTPGGMTYGEVKRVIKSNRIHTVCEEAHCPNLGECWGKGTLTFMILGDTCTRNCRFCAVNTGKLFGMVDEDEPMNVAKTIKALNLRYVVITSVDRDDLGDGGAEHYANTINAIHKMAPGVGTEVLIPDFSGKMVSIKTLMNSKPDVIAHNIETVKALSMKVRDRRAGYDRSLQVLEMIKQVDHRKMTKSSIMLGLGETIKDVKLTIRDLKQAGVDILTLGQYLQPSPKNIKVEHYYSPDEFNNLEEFAREVGFKFVASGALVRSSHRAAELLDEGMLKGSNTLL